MRVCECSLVERGGSWAARSMNQKNRFRGALLGLAVGDALGTTLEFKPPGSFEPISDMVGGGPFGLEPSQWTDDSSMAPVPLFFAAKPEWRFALEANRPRTFSVDLCAFQEGFWPVHLEITRVGI